MSYVSVPIGDQTNSVVGVVGVVGGGQLAKMLVEASKARNVDIFVQTKSLEDPAALNATRLVLAEAEDASGTMQLVRQCSAVTFENEWVNIEALMKLDLASGVDIEIKL